MGHLIINHRILVKHREFSLLALRILNSVSMELNLWRARTHLLALEDVTYLLECIFTPRVA